MSTSIKAPKLGKIVLVISAIALLSILINTLNGHNKANANSFELPSAQSSIIVWHEPDELNLFTPIVSYRDFESAFEDMDFHIPATFSLANQFSANTAVDVQETDKSYVVTVPIGKSSDSNGIQIQVLPHYISISGEVNLKSEAGYEKSSFLKSFTTNAELDPNRIDKQATNDKLVITISKKEASHSSQGDKAQPTSWQQVI